MGRLNYLSSYSIYYCVMGVMEAMGISSDELAYKLQLMPEDMESLLTPTRDYSISEIQALLGALHLDIKAEIVAE